MAAPTRRRSPLTPRRNQKRNTRSGRQRMSRASFALPKGIGSKPNQANYRIDDAAHARNALARVQQFGTPSEKRTVRRAVARKFPSIGTNGSGKRGSGRSGRSRSGSPRRR